ncbi:MAG: hypothetical protein HRT38_02750 [Alteromonadaceae bacterium]|nr:hypothetical protein [Alteromonadaceae bacterium]
MTRSIQDNLRAELLVLGQTAPQSWKENKLRSEIEKAKNQPGTQNVTVTDKNTGADGATNTTKQKQSDIKTTTQSNSNTDMNDQNEEVLNTTEAVPEDKVEVIAKAAFNNVRLGLKNISVGKKFIVSVKDADFLVNQDRTCKYVDK